MNSLCAVAKLFVILEVFVIIKRSIFQKNFRKQLAKAPGLLNDDYFF